MSFIGGRLARKRGRIAPESGSLDDNAAETATAAALPAKVLLLVTPVIAGGIVAVGFAAYRYQAERPSTADIASLLGLLASVVIAERFPVPVEGIDSGGVTLGFVFAVSAIVLLGWPAGVLIAAGAALGMLGHRPAVRAAYNGAMFALSALAGGLAVRYIHGSSPGALAAKVVLCAFLYNWVVNLVLISAVLAVSSGRRFVQIARGNIEQTTAPFALMTSASLMLVVLWQRNPGLSVALVGPLLAIALYQRSTFEVLRAMRLALTDPLTGLGNHRSFHERLQRELTAAEQRGTSLALCLFDLDGLKAVNDRFGHPTGDTVLGHVAARLRQGGEAFRLGGDEFAVLLPGHDERQATAVARSIVERIAAAAIPGVGSVTVSGGVATYPTTGAGRDELIRLADSALYWAKEDGKNRVRVYAGESVLRANLEQLADSPERAARYRAAESLAKAVDARDAYAGSHSQRVGEYAARIARRLGAEEPVVELTRLAGRLHDLGKLAIPEEILRKTGTVGATEQLLLKRHPQIGYRMLESLGIEPVAEWVLHHHERWDGTGYPSRLAGEQIPLGARIIFAADAYDAMTCEHGYGRRRTPGEALAELERCAGTQFDPAVVRAVAQELARDEPGAAFAS